MCVRTQKGHFPAAHSSLTQQHPICSLGHGSGLGWDPSFCLSGAGLAQTLDLGTEGLHRRGGHRWDPDVALGGRGLTHRLWAGAEALPVWVSDVRLVEV